MEPLLRVSDVSKRFRRRGQADVSSLEEVSFEIHSGGALALMGPNGSGKSTLARAVLGLVEPDAGAVRLAGKTVLRPRDASGMAGFAPADDRSLHLRLTARQNLRHAAGLKGLDDGTFEARLADLSEPLDLSPILDRRAADLSAGERQRVNLARALLGRPALLVLDEPARSLDEARRKSVWTLLARLRGGGTAILLCTHDPAEAAAVGAGVLRLEKGRAVHREEGEGAPVSVSGAPSVGSVHPLSAVRAGLRRSAAEEGGAWLSNGFWILGLTLELAAFFFLGRMLAPEAPAALAPYGGAYFPFVLVWFLFQGIQGAALHRLPAEVRSAQRAGTLETTVAGAGDPLWPLLATTLWGLAKGLAVAILGLAAWGILRGGFAPSGILLAAVAAAFAWAALLGAGLASAGILLAFQRGNFIPTLLGAAGPLLAGGLYPPEALPSWLRPAAEWFPQTPALRLARRGLLQGEGFAGAGGDLALLALFAAVFLGLGLWTFERGFRTARRRGALGRY